MPYATMESVPQALKTAGLTLSQANIWARYFDQAEDAGSKYPGAIAWVRFKYKFKKVGTKWVRKVKKSIEELFKVRPYLVGHTIQDQMPGEIKEDVTTMEQAKKLNKANIYKINWRTGKVKMRMTRAGLRQANIMAQLKAPEPCFAKDTLVWTNAGLRKMQYVKKGDLVLDHKGDWTPVLDCLRVPIESKELIEVTANECLRFQVTKNHPFLTPQGFVLAENLKRGDDLVMPEVKFKQPLGYLFFQKFEQNGLRGKPVFLELDESFGFFLGVACGDGCLSEYEITFSLGKGKAWMFGKLDSFCERYDMAHSLRKANESQGDYFEYKISDSQLSRLLRLIILNAKQTNTKSRFKEVSPEFLQRTNVKFLKGFTDGLMSTDGGETNFNSHSLGLISSFVFAKLLLGNVINFTSSKYKVDLSYLSRNPLGKKEYTAYQTSKVNKKKKYAVETENNFALKIKSVVKKSFNNFKWVYNLRTEAGTFCTVNAASHNSEWLDFEGVIQPGHPGATRLHPGVMVMLDKGFVEYGSQKPYYHEYFKRGGVLSGKLCYRELPSVRQPEVEKFETEDEVEKYCQEHEGEIIKEVEKLEFEELIKQADQPLPEAKPIPSLRRTFWIMMQPKDQTPYVLSPDAKKKSWLPPLGFSCMPKSDREKVPKELRFWEVKTKEEAKKMRDELVTAKIFKATVKGKFVLQYQTWRGPIQIRFGPTTKRWHLWVDGTKLNHVELNLDPTKNDSLRAMVETTGDRSLLGRGVKGTEAIKPSTKFNPTKNTPSTIERTDTGSCLILEDSAEFKKIEFFGKKLKGLWTLKREEPEMEIWVMERSEVPGEKFEKEFIPILKVDHKKQVVYGVVLEPEVFDAQVDIVSEEEIEKAAHDFLAFYRKIDLRHHFVTEKAFPVESYIAPHEMELGGEKVRKGSWILGTKVTDKKIWKDIEAGVLTGFSIVGYAQRIPISES